MSVSLKGVLDELRGSRHGVLPSTQAFPPLDVDELARRLDLERRAGVAGQQGLPSSSSDTEDSAELDVRAEIEVRARQAAEDYRAQLDLYEGRVRRTLIQRNERVKIEAAGQNALSNLKVQVSDDLNHLHQVHEEAVGRTQELNTFRQRHGLERLPHLISDRRRFFAVLVLLALLLFESIINGQFFAQGSRFGLIGGVQQAILLSVLNLAAAVFFGRYGLPLMSHSRVALKIAGFLSLIAYAAWAVVINLTIGHFRDLFVESKGQVVVANVQAKLLSAPLEFRDVESGVLVLLGLLFSIIAVIDAARMDDPYPGYGAIGRRRHAAVTRLAEEVTECRGRLEATRDESIQDMQSVIDEMRSSELELKLAMEGRSRLHANYRAFLDHAADGYRRLLQRYREANQRCRADGAVPQRFSQTPGRPAFLESDALSDLPEVTMDERSLVVRRMENFIREVNDEFQTAAERYASVGSMIVEGSRGAS